MTNQEAKTATLEHFAKLERQKNSTIAHRIAANAAQAAVNEFNWNDPLDWEDLEATIFTVVHVAIEQAARRETRRL